MKFNADFTEFNKRFAEELLPAFPNGVNAIQSDNGVLLFRGPIPHSDDPHHVGTHVSVALDEEVIDTLREATPAKRKEMIDILISNLGTQIRTQYNPDRIGYCSLDIVGRMNILWG